MMQMKMWSQSELYPPAEPAETRALLDGLLLQERIEGKHLIRRDITQAERAVLHQRRQRILPYIQKADYNDASQVILEMMIGFAARSETDEEAAVKTKQYCDVVAGQPLWAIKRACDRFAQGMVTAQDLGEKGRLSRTYVPSTAHLYVITSSLSRPFKIEVYRTRALLEGVFKNRRATDEGRKRVEESLARFKGSSGSETATEALRRDAERKEAARRSSAAYLKEGEEEQRVREFHAAGVDPHPTLTLSFLFSRGYTITDHPDGGRVLLDPPKPRRSRKGEKLNESSGDEVGL